MAENIENVMDSHRSILGPRTKEDLKILVPRKSQSSTDRIASYLVDKFSSPEHRNFFLRVAWRLDDGTINRYVGTANELGKNPRAYFISLVKKDKRYK